MATPITQGRALDMLRSLPPFYDNSPTIGALIASEGAEMDLIRGAVLAILGEMQAMTSTFMLPIHEWEGGLPDNSALTTTQRRERVVAQKRRSGTATIQRIREVAESFAFGGIDVEEDYANYLLRVRFADELGIPSNLEDVKKAIAAVIPAHLVLEFVYRYVAWWMIDNEGLTWAQFDALGLTWEQVPTHAGFLP